MAQFSCNSAKLLTFVVALSAAASQVGCAGSTLRSRAQSIETKLDAVAKPAYKCAPEDYAVARSELEFARIELDQGNYFQAKEHLEASSLATQRSELVAPRPECQEVVDRDGDGIIDRMDQCPDEPEDFDGFQDADGCPDPDNDGDGILDVNDKCPNEPEDFDGFEDEDGCPDLDNDKDGYPDAKDACPNEPEDFDGFQDEDGCPDPDNDGDHICDPWVSEKGLLDKYASVCKSSDKCPNEAEDFDGDADDDGCPDYNAIVVTADRIELKQTIYFATNKDVILSKSFGLLNEVAMALRDNPGIRVSIEGHTDSQGKDSYNKALSQRRADSVRRYLINQGVDGSRMVTIGYGEERPIDDNRTASGRAANRRVEFIILK